MLLLVYHWMELNDTLLYHMFPLCTYFRFCSKFLGFTLQITDFVIFEYGDMRGVHLLTITLPIPLNGNKWNFHRIFIVCSHCAPPISDFDTNQYVVQQVGEWEYQVSEHCSQCFWFYIISFRLIFILFSFIYCCRVTLMMLLKNC